MDALLERFFRYVKTETQSSDSSQTVPSTSTQLTLANMLVNELKQMGLQEVSVDANGYVMATLPANIEKKVPVIGFVSHMDTSPDFTAVSVNPKLVKYLGGDIILNEKETIVLSPKQFPELNHYVGETLITTDGTTLLGADDKAGVAEIITAMDYLIQHPEIPHGKIRVGFTPDEEIGRGADHFNVEKFGADFAYTIDGGGIGELEYENFNAAKAQITIQGLNVHPGTAKNQMVNSQLIAMELNAMLPANEVPSHTEKYEGFYHLIQLSGTVENTSMMYIIRDHSMPLFIHRKQFISEVVNFLNLKYGSNTVTLKLTDQYFNMKEKIEPVFHIVELARKAMEQCGVEPKVIPIRGGTDGSRLSYMGLPCPNLFAGGHNFHGRYEFIPVKSMEKAVEVIVKIVELNTKE